MSAGKGDKPRPLNKKQYDNNFEKIKWENKNKFILEIKTRKGKQTIYYKNS